MISFTDWFIPANNFAVRQKAVKALIDLPAPQESQLRKALAENPPLEVRQRIKLVLEKREKEAIRRLRVIETLEQIRTPEARDLLQALVKTGPNPRVIAAANAALQRLAGQSK